MILLELLMLLGGILLMIICSATDIKDGKIYNRILLWFAAAGCVLDFLYYFLFLTDMPLLFMENFLSVGVLSIFLFAVHRLAGGDCKLLIVLSLFYPARFLLTFFGQPISLWLVIPFSLIFGYLFLAADTVFSMLRKKVSVSQTVSTFRSNLKLFLINYLKCGIYIALINQTVYFLSLHQITVSPVLIWILCLITGWFCSQNAFFSNIYVLAAALGADLFLFLFNGIRPFSFHMENYLIILFLLLSRSLIQSRIYQAVQIDQLKPGMILSVGSSLMMQSSRIRGLPGVSVEDLRNRLTESEIESIKKWGLKSGNQELEIVRKIPFAPFISLGFIAYYLIWRLIS